MSLNAPRDLGLAPRTVLTALVVAAHLGVGWAVLSLSMKPAEVAQPKVLEVSWIAPAQPDSPPQPQAPQPPQAQRAQPKPVEPALRTPQPQAAALAPAPVALPAANPQPAAVPSPVAAVSAKADAAPPAEPVAAPAPPAAPKLIASSALRYLEPLKPVYPRVSTELCETGVVTLNILVNEWGVPIEVAVEKSSGHDRLDQSALNAMRAARFKPYTEAGQARSVRAHPTINFQLDC